jgi:hypothetical protein
MSNASDWAPPEIDFDKLDDLPKGRPHTQQEVMAALKVLFKMIHAQARAYGGKNSKLLPVGIAEGKPTFAQFNALVDKKVAGE